MAEWWKALAETFRKVDHPKKNLSLKERLEEERNRLREEEEKWKRGGGNEPHPNYAVDARIRQEDARALATLIGWKLDVHLEEVTENPVNVDGYWFGVQRYVSAPEEEDGPYVTYWKLFVFRPCTQCKFLIPTLELGDYIEVVAATKQMALGQDAYVPKSTQKLAQYLNEIEGGRFDPHLPRVCPHCRSLLKGSKTT
ncbi:MAG: hypothetical protein OHK0029_10070 [Armatimonadaceae bacterium]